MIVQFKETNMYKYCTSLFNREATEQPIISVICIVVNCTVYMYNVAYLLLLEGNMEVISLKITIVTSASPIKQISFKSYS